jgi:hypothetical protein
LLPALPAQIKRREARVRTTSDTDFIAEILSGAFKSIIGIDPRSEPANRLIFPLQDVATKVR